MRADPKIGLAVAAGNGKFIQVVSDPFDITNRIREIEDEYFILYNRYEKRFEVHSTAQPIRQTYCFTVPFDTLDNRTLEYCRETNIAMRGDKIEKEIEERNSKLSESNDRANTNLIQDIALDMADRVSHGILEDEIHEGYTSTHVIDPTEKHDSVEVVGEITKESEVVEPTDNVETVEEADTKPKRKSSKKKTQTVKTE